MQTNQKLEHWFPRSRGGREVEVIIKRHQETLVGDGVMDMFTILIMLMVYGFMVYTLIYK